MTNYPKHPPLDHNNQPSLTFYRLCQLDEDRQVEALVLLLAEPGHDVRVRSQQPHGRDREQAEVAPQPQRDIEKGSPLGHGDDPQSKDHNYERPST